MVLAADIITIGVDQFLKLLGEEQPLNDWNNVALCKKYNKNIYHLHDFLFLWIALFHFLCISYTFYPYVKSRSKLLLNLFLIMWSILLMVKISFLTRYVHDLIKNWRLKQLGSCQSIFTGFWGSRCFRYPLTNIISRYCQYDNVSKTRYSKTPPCHKSLLLDTC